MYKSLSRGVLPPMLAPKTSAVKSSKDFDASTIGAFFSTIVAVCFGRKETRPPS